MRPTSCSPLVLTALVAAASHAAAVPLPAQGPVAGAPSGVVARAVARRPTERPVHTVLVTARPDVRGEIVGAAAARDGRRAWIPIAVGAVVGLGLAVGIRAMMTEQGSQPWYRDRQFYPAAIGFTAAGAGAGALYAALRR